MEHDGIAGRVCWENNNNGDFAHRQIRTFEELVDQLDDIIQQYGLELLYYFFIVKLVMNIYL